MFLYIQLITGSIRSAYGVRKEFIKIPALLALLREPGERSELL